MILISDLYNTLLDLVRADKRGESLSVEEFNRVIRLVNQEVYDAYYDSFEDGIDNIDTLGGFKVINYTIPLVLSGEFMTGTIPANYYEMIGKPRILSSGTYRRCDLVTEYEHGDRAEDYLTQATLTHPYCLIGGVNASDELQIRVLPTTVTGNIYLSYLRSITVPYLDYYVNDTTLVKTFMADTTALVSIPTGSTYRDGTVGGVAVTKVSQTVNLEWDDSDMNLILAKLMTKMGVQLPDEFLTQSGMADQLKAEA